MADSKKTFNTLIKVIIGLIFLIGGVVAVLRWWNVIILLFKGFVGPFLILAGAIFLLLAKD